MAQEKITYYCPKHSKIILFTENVMRGVNRIMGVSEKPVRCNICNKYYYKHQCIAKGGDNPFIKLF